jgi:hypothetical protein
VLGQCPLGGQPTAEGEPTGCELLLDVGEDELGGARGRTHRGSAISGLGLGAPTAAKSISSNEVADHVECVPGKWHPADELVLLEGPSTREIVVDHLAHLGTETYRRQRAESSARQPREPAGDPTSPVDVAAVEVGMCEPRPPRARSSSPVSWPPRPPCATRPARSRKPPATPPGPTALRQRRRQAVRIHDAFARHEVGRADAVGQGGVQRGGSVAFDDGAAHVVPTRGGLKLRAARPARLLDRPGRRGPCRPAGGSCRRRPLRRRLPRGIDNDDHSGRLTEEQGDTTQECRRATRGPVR